MIFGVNYYGAGYGGVEIIYGGVKCGEEVGGGKSIQ